MRLAAILLVPRYQSFFHFDEAIVFKKFKKDYEPPTCKIKCFYHGEGVATLLVFNQSKIDKTLMKTNYLYYFPSRQHLLAILTALHESDKLTEKLKLKLRRVDE